MLRRIFAFSTVALALAAGADRPIKVVLVGDSTVNDEGGWGPGFRASFGPEIQVVNLALNGRSSKSFRDEGAWAKVLPEKPDFVLIQFGHNDVPGKGPERETDPATTYRANMERYVEEVRAAGATPVLVTSIVRRNFDDQGKFKPDSLVPYAEAVRRLAVERKVALIDLYTLTREQTERLGAGGQRDAGAAGRAGQARPHPSGPEGPDGNRRDGREGVCASRARRSARRCTNWSRGAMPCGSPRRGTAARRPCASPTICCSTSARSADGTRTSIWRWRLGPRSAPRSKSRSAIPRRTPPSTTTLPIRRCDTWRASSRPPGTRASRPPSAAGWNIC